MVVVLKIGPDGQITVLWPREVGWAPPATLAIAIAIAEALERREREGRC